MWTALETGPERLPWRLCKPTLRTARCLWALMVKYETQARLSLACHVHNKHVYLMATCLWFNLWLKQIKRLARTNTPFSVEYDPWLYQPAFNAVLRWTNSSLTDETRCQSILLQWKSFIHIHLIINVHTNFEHSKMMACRSTDCHLEKKTLHYICFFYMVP